MIVKVEISNNVLSTFSVSTGIKPTTDGGPFGLKIYFTDEGNDDTRSTERIDKDSSEQDAEHDNKLHKFLLTSTKEKHINSRHELYKNPRKPEIKFRTESPFSLKTVASPLLVQNSVKNRLIENTKRRLKKRRAERDKRSVINKAKAKATSTGSVWPKAFSVNGASWFKRYQALYNDMLKRNGHEAATTYKIQNPIDYYNDDNQLGQVAQRNALPTAKYYFNYIYPLYHLHATESQRQYAYQNYLWNKAQQNTQLRSRNVVPGTHPFQNSPQVREFTTNARNSLPDSITQHQIAGQSQKIPSRHLLQEPTKLFEQSYLQLGSKIGTSTWPYIGRRTSFANSLQNPKEYKRIQNSAKSNSVMAVQESTLQNIGLRDDASFMEASPNYDNSELTLHAMQSLIPKAQVKSIIPEMKQTPMITTKDSGTESKWSSMADNADGKLENPLQNDLDMRGLRQMGMGPENTSSRTLLLINSVRGRKTRKQNTERSDITRPVSDKITPEKNGITLGFFKEAKKRRIEFPPENDDVKRDVMYKPVNPLSDIDSDDVTAENLAAIFNELDGRIDEVLQDNVAKKDAVARPQQNDISKPQGEIEMTVYDTSKDIPIQKSTGVNFVNVTGENETNFQQSLEMQDIEKDNKIGAIREAIIRPHFDLKKLHFGLRNGNTFD